MKKVVLASLLAAVALFFWGFLYWVPLAIALDIYQPARNETALVQALKEHLGDTDGFYFVPGAMADPAELEARHAAGPIVTISYVAGGRPMMDPKTFAFGFLHEWASALLMGLLLAWLAPRLRSFGERVKLVAGAGFICAFFGNMARPLWLVQPWGYHIFQTVYEITCWLLVALILGWFINGSEK